ncbi:alpha/beta fold hydrolase [Rhodobacteraceae bacterium 2CG4]|uniref:Alpha/beta fold hydrolase n=1 Tax=Halovulum marinum TaxID=2662447 RepID=A0A6L5YVE6_9RHOB|nr:alpha/beta fold hydrolase [Halovulum marinum]MSU88228.1 alpha/beta fold hydrolase [Halovulum marinum]
MLNLLEYPGPGGGTGAGPGAVPLVIAHGLFGSARNWNVIAKRLGDARPVVAVDMRNHGDSPWSDDHSYPAMAEDLAGVIDRFGGVADVLGHSMGGKAAMVLAGQAPDRVRRLIVADIAPVAYAHSQAPMVAAMQAVDLGRVGRRSDADAQLKPHVEEPALRAFLLQSLAIENGGARWKLNLAALAGQIPLIMGFPANVRPFEGPAALLRGGASDYVGDARLPAVRALLPRVEVVTLDGLGHWPHAEDPRGFEAELRRILD